MVKSRLQSSWHILWHPYHTALQWPMNSSTRSTNSSGFHDLINDVKNLPMPSSESTLTIKDENADFSLSAGSHWQFLKDMSHNTGHGSTGIRCHLQYRHVSPGSVKAVERDSDHRCPGWYDAQADMIWVRRQVSLQGKKTKLPSAWKAFLTSDEKKQNKKTVL